jgi:prefoldin subunit 5
MESIQEYIAEIARLKDEIKALKETISRLTKMMNKYQQ